MARALNATSFGQADPVFNQDVGFYVFQLPAYEFIWGWLMGLAVVAFISAGGIYATRSTSTPGAIELPPGSVGHLSLLGSAFFLLLAAHYRIAMFSMVISKGVSVVFGAGYTDLHLKLPVYWVMLVLVLLLALALLANVFVNRSWLLVGAPLGWLLMLVLLEGAAPNVYQYFFVKPNELGQESDNIRREIDATNHAYGLDNVVFKDFTDQQTITPDLLATNSGTVNNLRLWDYGPLKSTYNQIQTIRQYYDFHDVDIDRYALSDGYRQLMISARELSPSKLPDSAKTWVNQHLAYTHGYGAAATPVNKVAGEGLPDLVLKDIPPTGEPKLDNPQIYFGETTSNYVIVDTKERELDYEKDNVQRYSQWEGTNGIKMSFLHRLAFAYQLADPNVILSSQITDTSQMLYRRDITERLKTLAPFLTYDSDPYIVVAGGKMEWIADAYTTADNYPYSDPYDATLGVNYIRNSVKAVVDPYNGSVIFYVADDKDPVIKTYAKIFPGTFRPISDMPADLRAHVRYPEDLFSIQSERLRNYHMHDPQAFYQKADSWAQPTEVKGQGDRPAPAALLRDDEAAGAGPRGVRPDPAVHPAEQIEHGGVAGGALGRCRLRAADNGALPHQPAGHRAGAGREPHRPGHDHLAGSDPAQPERLQRHPRQPAGDPDRRQPALPGAGLHRVHQHQRRARAEEGDRRRRDPGGLGRHPGAGPEPAGQRPGQHRRAAAGADPADRPLPGRPDQAPQRPLRRRPEQAQERRPQGLGGRLPADRRCHQAAQRRLTQPLARRQPQAVRLPLVVGVTRLGLILA